MQPGKYLIDPSGHARYLVDSGIGGRLTKTASGTPIQKFNPPQPQLFATLIEGIMTQKLPWGLVVLGAVLAIVMQLSGVSALAFAVGVYLPLATTLPIFVGGVLRGLVDRARRLTPEEAETSPGTLMSTGLIAGGSLAGIIIALLIIFEDFGKKIDFSTEAPGGEARLPHPGHLCLRRDGGDPPGRRPHRQAAHRRPAREGRGGPDRRDHVIGPASPLRGAGRRESVFTAYCLLPTAYYCQGRPIMRRFLIISAGLVLGLDLLASAARAQGWYYPGGYGNYGMAGWGGDPMAAYMTGLGSYARRQGVYKIDRAKARAIKIDNTIKWNKAVRARQRVLRQDQKEQAAEEEAERQGKLAERRLVSGATLNALLDQIYDVDPGVSKVAGSKAPISPEAIREIPFEWNSEAITACIDQLTGTGSSHPDAPDGRPVRRRAQRPARGRRAGPQGGRPGDRLPGYAAGGSTTRSPISAPSSSRTPPTTTRAIRMRSTTSRPWPA